jgi:hypothetical protein
MYKNGACKNCVRERNKKRKTDQKKPKPINGHQIFYHQVLSDNFNWHRHGDPWTDYEDSIIEMKWNETTDDMIAELLPGRTMYAVRKRRRALGFYRSPQIAEAMRQYALIKKIINHTADEIESGLRI